MVTVGLKLQYSLEYHEWIIALFYDELIQQSYAFSHDMACAKMG